jgi:hypothetical protein
MWNKIYFLMAGSMVLGSTACEMRSASQKEPKEVIQRYIAASFNARSFSDKGKLTPLLTGEVKERLVNLEEESFKKRFLDPNRKFIRLRFREIQEVSPGLLNLTYEITYSETRKNGYEATVTNRKLAELVLIDEKWFIQDVKSLRQLIEFEDELAFP